jgi:hypothetical protein
MSDRRPTPQNRSGTGALRDERGRIRQGATLNPGGRPRTPEDVRQALCAALPKAVDRLIALLDSPDEKLALAAAQAVIARVLGREPVALEEVSQLSDDEVVAFLARDERFVVRLMAARSALPGEHGPESP